MNQDAAATEQITSLAHVGARAVEDGLPGFSNAVDLLERESRTPTSVASIGTGGRVGGLDGVSYFYRRAKQWSADHIDVRPHADIYACLEAALAADRAVVDVGRRVSTLHRLVAQTPRTVVVSAPDPPDYVSILTAASAGTPRMTAAGCISVIVGELARALERRGPAQALQPLQLSPTPPSVCLLYTSPSPRDA